jgi:Zn-dependent protease
MQQILPSGKNNSIPLLKIAGIRIMLDYSWFIIFALVTWSIAAGYFPREFPGLSQSAYWTAGIIASILFFFSIIIHELMHSVIAMKSGIKIVSITLFIFGGASHLSREAKTPWNELWIALSGPLTSIVLGMAIWGAVTVIRGDVSPLIVSVFNYLAWINIFLGIFNLVPAFPLDGGRVLRAIVWWKTGNPIYAIRLSTDFGKGFALAIIVLGAFQIFKGELIAGAWLVLIGLFLRSMAYSGMHEFEISHSMENMKVKHIMIENPISVPPDITVDRLITDYLFRTTLREFPVQRDGELLGLVSLDQFANVEKDSRSHTTVGDIMTPISDQIRISPEKMLSDALQKMNSGNINRLLVMDDGKLIGIITKTGVLRLLELKSG